MTVGIDMGTTSSAGAKPSRAMLDLEELLATRLLVQGNSGSGKSHLLRYIRDHALSERYAVSFVTLDAKSGVRFNRMDQIMGAILRNIEIPPHLGPQGLRGA